MSFYRPTWIEISPSAFAENIRSVRQYLGENVRLMAVLKADAYGHGVSALAGTAIDVGASMLGVSSLEEGIALRSAGLNAPILILGSIFPLENFDVAIKYDLTPTVASLESAQALSLAAEKAGRSVDCHLKVDTGMGRIGVSVHGADTVLEWLRGQMRVRLAGLYSHFACADGDPEFTKLQLERFESVTGAARASGFKSTLFHIANSAATFNLRESHLDMVRMGIALYGADGLPIPSDVSLLPVLSWHSKIVFLKKVAKGTSISYGRTHVTARESEIATLPVGYADGIPRRVSNRAVVLVRGQRAPLVGRVTMDQIMIDVTGTGAQVGDQVTLIGRADGDEITVGHWAEWAETISYEIFCGLTRRVPRVVVE